MGLWGPFIEIGRLWRSGPALFRSAFATDSDHPGNPVIINGVFPTGRSTHTQLPTLLPSTIFTATHLPPFPLAMNFTLPADGLSVHVTAQPLTQQAFAPFGDVVANPQPRLHPSSPPDALPANARPANQGTAIQYHRGVSRFQNLYAQAPSRSPGTPTMTIFAVAERPLTSSSSSSDAEPGRGEFTVRFMERHPFSSQTFTPLASSLTAYLVVVAPSLPPGAADEHLPVPSRQAQGGEALPGRGLPDMKRLRAFVATSGQAVTYGAGTWHAPMVALGRPGGMQSFQVVQFTSGEAVEDCQLVALETRLGRDPDITVRIPAASPRGKL